MCCGRWFWGLLFILMGVLWIAQNHNLVHINLADWWPVIIILIGISMLVSGPRYPWMRWRMSGRWRDVDWDDEDIENEAADTLERVSKKAAKKMRKSRKKK